jgi:hypothetical protein
MKKSFILVFIAVFVMIPFASFAKTTMSDSELETVAGQAGFTITFSNFTISPLTDILQNIVSPNKQHPPKIIPFFRFFGNIFVPSYAGGANSQGNGYSYMNGFSTQTNGSVIVYAH